MSARRRRAEPAKRGSGAAKRARAEALEASRVDTAPPERWQHGQELAKSVAPRFPTSVASGVLALRKAQYIDDAEVTAADRFVADYVFGVEGVRDPAMGGGGGGDTAHAVQIARAEAITRHRAIEELIGAGMTQWLVAFLVMDLSFVAMAERFMPSRASGRTEMKGRLTTLLLLLSQMYAVIDRRTKRSG